MPKINGTSSDNTLLNKLNRSIDTNAINFTAINQDYGYGIGIRSGNDITAEARSTYFGGIITTTERTIGIPISCSVNRAYRPSTASILSITSSDTNDTSAGSGGREVICIGLDASYNPITEIIALSGQTPSLGSVEFIRVHKMILTDVGSSETNEGDVYASISGETYSSGVPTTTIRCAMQEGLSLSSWGMRMVELGRRSFYTAFDFYTSATQTKPMVLKEYDYIYNSGASGNTIKLVSTDLTLSAGIHFQSPAPPPINEKIDYEYTGVVGTGTVNMTAYIHSVITNMP